MSDPMRDPRTTNWLLLWIGLMMFNKFYPDTSRTYWYFALAALAVWAVYSFVKTWRRDEAERKKERAEIESIAMANDKDYMAAFNAIREKYGFNFERPEYQREVAELRAKYGYPSR
jgi:hypothetical protein